MPAATTATRPAMPTISEHRAGCPAKEARQEVWIADIHGRDGAVTGQSGVAHCMDCGKVERVPLAKVRAYLGHQTAEGAPDHG